MQNKNQVNYRNIFKYIINQKHEENSVSRYKLNVFNIYNIVNI